MLYFLSIMKVFNCKTVSEDPYCSAVSLYLMGQMSFTMCINYTIYIVFLYTYHMYIYTCAHTQMNEECMNALGPCGSWLCWCYNKYVDCALLGEFFVRHKACFRWKKPCALSGEEQTAATIDRVTRLTQVEASFRQPCVTSCTVCTGSDTNNYLLLNLIPIKMLSNLLSNCMPSWIALVTTVT